MPIRQVTAEKALLIREIDGRRLLPNCLIREGQDQPKIAFGIFPKAKFRSWVRPVVEAPGADSHAGWRGDWRLEPPGYPI